MREFNNNQMFSDGFSRLRLEFYLKQKKGEVSLQAKEISFTVTESTSLKSLPKNLFSMSITA